MSTVEEFKTVRLIAEDLKLSYQALLNYQLGVRIPNKDILERISKYFNINYFDLVNTNIDNKNIKDTNSDTKPKQRIYELKLPFSNKANENLKILIRKNDKVSKERIATLNELLENKDLLDNIRKIIDYKK